MNPVKIFFAAQDPGGFNAILPVIKGLKQERNFLLKIFLSNQSRNIAKRNKINYHNSNHLTERNLIKIFKKDRPNLIFTATSYGSSIEKKITKIAKTLDIRTCAIVDFWANYRSRFSDFDSENLAYLPDYILVTDEIMKREMTKEGFDPRKLIITGNPFFDTFLSLLKLGKKEKIISFFCQPFSELYKIDDKAYPGYNEIQVFQDLVSSLEKLKLRLPLKIKFHPVAKNLKKFDRIIKGAKLKISIERKLSAENLIKKSKLVIGMWSIVLLQAALLGKKVLSYQPNLKGRDVLISNRLGISTAVYRKDGLYPALKKMLSSRFQKKNIELIKKYIQNQSAKKVINFIKKITC